METVPRPEERVFKKIARNNQIQEPIVIPPLVENYPDDAPILIRVKRPKNADDLN